MLVGTALLTVPRMGAVRRTSIQPARTRRTVAPKERPAIASMSPIFGAIALARNAIGRRRPVSERCLRLLQPMPPKPAEKPFDTALIDVVLDTLLQRNPPPQIVAIDEMGFFVPMPPAMPAQVGRLFNGRTSALQLVTASDLSIVVATWERALRKGVADDRVQLLASADERVELHFVDSRHRYGVLLGFVFVSGTLIETANADQTVIRPRVWHLRKDQFAVIREVDAVMNEILGWTPQEMIGRRSTEFGFALIRTLYHAPST
jgi:hypothetical protein